jgi:biotin carboxylase
MRCGPVSKTVLVVSGGSEAVPGIQHARRLGYRVVVADRDPTAPGMRSGHDAIVASTYDVDGMIAAARRYAERIRPIDGVLSIAADVPLTVAGVADALGLPGPSLETARLAADKLAMKECLSAHGIPIPWFSPVGSASELERIVAHRGLPLVIKPVDSRGARGVLRLTPGVDLVWAFAEAVRSSPTGRVLVEEYLHGPQFSTESVLFDGEAWTPGFAERNYEFLERFSPHMIENGGQQPAGVPAADMAALRAVVEAAGRAVGLTRGIVKGDLVLTPSGPRVIEIATRLSGGWFCTDQIPLATGVDLVGAALRLAVGDGVDRSALVPQRERGVAIRYFFPQAGRVVAIRSVLRFRVRPWVHRLGLFVRVGAQIDPPTNHTLRAGFVITRGATADEAVRRAEAVVRGVQIVTTAAPAADAA